MTTAKPFSEPTPDSLPTMGASSIPHILVVDDELAMRDSLQEILELEGFQVSQADER